MINKLPNILTGGRIVFALLFLAVETFEHDIRMQVIGLFFFFFGSVTDIYDGVIARKYGVVSRLGKLMDPIADKALVASALIILVHSDFINVPGWTVALIIIREFSVTGLRLLAASDGVSLGATDSGKAKTIFQMIGIHYMLVIALFENYARTFYELEGIHTIAELKPELGIMIKTALAGVPFFLYGMTLATVVSGYRIFTKNLKFITQEFPDGKT